MIVLVAGGAGLLGSAIARRLLGDGHAVVLADWFDGSGDGRAMKEARVAALPRASLSERRLDLTDGRAVEDLLAERRPDVVVQAARLAPGAGGALPLLDAARAARVKLVVHLSDADLYAGPADGAPPAREDEEIDPGDDEVLLARAAEEAWLLRSLLSYVVFRVFTPISAVMTPGRFPAEALEALLEGREVVLPDDDPRDFIHVDDAARSVSRAIRKPPGRTLLNLGSGVATRPSRLVALLGEAARRSPIVAVRDPSPARRRPRIASLEASLRTLHAAPGRLIEKTAAEIVRERMRRAR